MPILIQCQKCGKRLKAPVTMKGKRAKCKCGAVVVVQESGSVDHAEDLVLLTDQEVTEPDGRTECPSCHAPMPNDAMLCTQCGFHRGSEARLETSVAESPQKPIDSEATGTDVKAKAARSPDMAPRIIGVTMKVALWVIILGAVAGSAWFLKEGLSFSPAKQAAEAQSKVYPGMTVQAVVDALGGKLPQEVHAYEEKKTASGAFPIPMDRRIAYREDFMKNTKKELLKYGFYFIYRFSERDNLVIHFGPDGKVQITQMVDPMKLIGL